jgi:hypothetical protein
MANGGTPYGPGKVVVSSQVGVHCMAWSLWGKRGCWEWRDTTGHSQRPESASLSA